MHGRLKLILLVFIVLILTNCEKSVFLPYAETETKIRNEYDKQSVFTWELYKKLLTKLKDNKFVVLPLNEMRNTYDESKVVVGLRHDIDFNPFKALEMAKIENEYGISSTYYILATADYYGHLSGSGIVRNQGMEQLYKELFIYGHEVGIHNDLLTIEIQYGIDPIIFNQNEISFYSSLDIPVHGTSSHGSPIAKETVPNYMIFSDFAKMDSVIYKEKKYPIGQHSLSDYGYEYEAYFIDFNLYFSDSRGKWNDPDGLEGILKKLDESKPGDRIQILAHPDWWGKN